MSQAGEIPEETFAPTAGEVLVSVSASLLLGAMALWSPLALSLALMVLGTIMGLGWTNAFGITCSRGCHWTLAMGSMVIMFAALSESVGQWPSSMAAAVAAVMLIHFVQQILREDGRPRLTETMALSVLAIALSAAGAALIPLGVVGGNGRLATVTLAGAAAGALADLAGGMRALRLWILPFGMVLAAGASVALGRYLGLEPGPTALLGVSASIVGHPVRWILAQVPETSSPSGQLVVGIAGTLSAGALPLVAAQLFFLTGA